MDKVNSIPLPAFMEPYYAKGILDTSFGVNGITTGVINRDDVYYSFGNSLVTDQYGRIYVAGNIISGTVAEMTLWRFKSDGSLDFGFGTNGCITNSALYVDGDLNAENGASGMTIDSNGVIYITGVIKKSDHNNMIIWKYDDHAKINKFTIFAIFDAYEFSQTPGGNSLGKKVKIDNRGRIIVCGVVVVPDTKIYMALWRYTSDGMLDEGFNSTGVIISDASEGERAPAIQTLCNDFIIDDEDNIVACGSVAYEDDEFVNYPIFYKCMSLWRYRENGTPDLNFCNGGLFVGDNASFDVQSSCIDYGMSVIIDSQDRILVSGTSQNEITSLLTMAIWCFDENGELDDNFGNKGMVRSNRISEDYYEFQKGMTIVSDSKNRLLVSGYYNEGFVIWRYYENGMMDHSFGLGGYLPYEMTHNSIAGASMIMDYHGKILLLDTCFFEDHSEMTLWRFK